MHRRIVRSLERNPGFVYNTGINTAEIIVLATGLKLCLQFQVN